MKIRKAPHCPEMEQMLGKLPRWLPWAGITVIAFLAILFVIGYTYLNGRS